MGRDDNGNVCEAILATVQMGQSITGRYGFTAVNNIPAGWRFPTESAPVEGEVFPDRQAPFDFISQDAIRQWQQSDRPHGLHARLAIGDKTFYALMAEITNCSMILCERDDVNEIQEVHFRAHSEFSSFNLWPSSEFQLSRRLALLKTWLEDEQHPEVRAKIEEFACKIEPEIEPLRQRRAAHLLVQPQQPGQHTGFSGNYTFQSSNNMSGEWIEATLELCQSDAGGEISGLYTVDPMCPSVSWEYPKVGGPITGEVFLDRPAWTFATKDACQEWSQEESSLALPGGPLEARIEFSGMTRYMLRTADGYLFLNEKDSVKYLRECWSPKQ